MSGDLHAKFNKLESVILDDIRKTAKRSEVPLIRTRIKQLSDLINEDYSSIPAYHLKYYTNKIDNLEKTLAEKTATFQHKFAFAKKLNSQKYSGKVLNNNASNGNLESESVEKNFPKVLELLQEQFIGIQNQTTTAESEKPVVLRDVLNSHFTIVAKSVHCVNCSDVKLDINTSGPITCNQCKNIEINGTCHQVRMHDITQGIINASVISNEVITENCSNIQVSDKSIRITKFESPLS